MPTISSVGLYHLRSSVLKPDSPDCNDSRQAGTHRQVKRHTYTECVCTTHATTATYAACLPGALLLQQPSMQTKCMNEAPHIEVRCSKALLTHESQDTQRCLLLLLIEGEGCHVSLVRRRHRPDLVVKPWDCHTTSTLQGRHPPKAMCATHSRKHIHMRLR